jgi:hypothetical protein
MEYAGALGSTMRAALDPALLVGIALAMSACDRQPPQSAPPALKDVSSASASASASSVAAPSASAQDAGDADSGEGEDDSAATAPPEIPGGVTAPVGSWGISLTVPPAARVEHEAHADRHSVYLSSLVSVTLHLARAPAPASLADAAEAWNSDDDSRNLGEGVTRSGVLYGVRTFKVRVGVPSPVRGQHIHTYEKVSRVYAVLPLDKDKSVRCTGYVERGVQSESDPDIQAVRSICLSMRPHKASK